MKRSVSPQTITEPEGGPVPKKRKFLGLISSLASRLFSKQEAPSQKAPGFFASDGPAPDDLPSEFVSQKRRLSILGSLKNVNDAVPRMSTSIPHYKGYQEIAQTLQRQKDDFNGATEHERRQSFLPPAVPDFALNGQEESTFLKDLSPNLYNVPRQSILPKMDRDMEYNNSDDYGDEPQNQLVEQEFAPLYEDDDGNLLRPPVINLDPSERYHLLQLKRSVEMSEYLQSRLKYMVDPDETTSVPIGETKVNSTTQTHGVDEFDRKLNFDKLRSKLTLQRRQRQQRNGKGFFSGEFFYEPAPPKKSDPVSNSVKLDGYLGQVNKPKFPQQKTEKPVKLFPDQDSNPPVTLQKNRRTDLGAVLGKRDEPQLDKDYLDKTESLIKMKEPGAAQATNNSVGPSSGFNFEINKNSLGNILQTRKDDDERVEKASAASEIKSAEDEGKRALFGFSSTSSKDQPKKRSRGEEEGSKPSFLFGNQSASDEKKPLFEPSKPLSDEKKELPKPAFSFGTSEKPSEKKESTSGFSFGKPSSTPLFGGSSTKEGKADEKENKTSEAPKFSFGSSKLPEAAPKFSFGSSTNDKSSPGIPFGGSATVKVSDGNKDTPKFLFGLKPEKENDDADEGPRKKRAAPFSFDTIKSEEKSEPGKDEKPLFSFDKPKDSAPSLLNFGESSKKEATPQLTFASLSEKKDSTPLFNFGGSEKKTDAPVFGSGLSEKKDITPSFNFGANTEKKDDAAPKLGAPSSGPTPAFKFGGSSELKDTKKDAEKEDTPKFSFGGSSTKDSTPTFSFGAKKDEEGEKKADASTLGSLAPKFSFEKPKSEEPQDSTEAPKFTFGAAKSVSPSFTFGGSKPADTSFGSKTNEVKETTPVFSVSSKETTPKPFLFGEPTAKPAFNFGSAQTPAFGADSKSTSTFSFGKPETPLIGAQPGSAAAPKPAFTFGQAATADPALIFGASESNTQGSQATPAFGGPSTGPSSTASPFNFGATQAPAFGGPSGAFGGPNPTPGFNFGANTNLAAPQPTQSPFGGPANTSSVFGSRGSTPGAPGNTFGQPGAGITNPASVFGANPTQSSGGFGMGSNAPPNQFNSAPGSLGAGSRENTPPVFGAGAPGAPGAFGAGQLFTPPLAMKGRQIARMRPRRR